MSMFAIRQLYVQFSMTIFIISPTVYTTQQSNLSDSYLYLIHGTLADWYMLLFNFTIASYMYTILYLNSITIPLKENFDKAG